MAGSSGFFVYVLLLKRLKPVGFFSYCVGFGVGVGILPKRLVGDVYFLIGYFSVFSGFYAYLGFWSAGLALSNNPPVLLMLVKDEAFPPKLNFGAY